MSVKKLIVPLLLIMLMSFSLPALANTGRIVYLTGDVQVNGKPMGKLHKVKGGDKITTGADGKVNIIMADKSILDLRPNTKFMLERFKFNKKEPSKSHSIMSLFSGSFRYVSGLVGRTNHENATIKMGTATAGIRGSVASFKFNGKTVKITTILGVTTMKMGGKSFTFNAGTTATGNTITGVAKSGSVSKEDQKLVDALNDLKTGKVPKDLTDDELVLMMGAVLAEGEALGITQETMAKLVTQMVKQAKTNAAATAIAAAAIVVAQGLPLAQTLAIEDAAFIAAGERGIDVLDVVTRYGEQLDGGVSTPVNYNQSGTAP